MKKSIYRLIILLIGNALLALGVSAFITQTNLIMGGGTGIGLSFVKAIMNNYENAYGVINKEDGVEFYFDLDLDI